MSDKSYVDQAKDAASAAGAVCVVKRICIVLGQALWLIIVSKLQATRYHKVPNL